MWASGGGIPSESEVGFFFLISCCCLGSIFLLLLLLLDLQRVGVMSEPAEGTPKLFVNKPKAGVAPPSAGVKAEAIGSVPYWYRFRAAAGALLLINVGVGGYVLFTENKSKKVDKRSHEHGDVHRTAAAAAVKEDGLAAGPTQAAAVAPVVAPVAWVAPAKTPISHEEQKELIRWVLDEKRKLKPKSKAEKAKLNEEKALLKEYLRAKHLPSF